MTRPPFAFAISLALAAAGAAAAQDLNLPQFSMPAGCSLLVTAQHSDCTAQVVYSCAADEPGHRHIADILPEGLSYLSTVNATYTWVDGLDGASGLYEQTVFPVIDPMDTNVLMANGIDAFVLTQVHRATGERIHYTGYDRLTGSETVIDGVRLLETEFQIRAVDDAGAIVYQVAGSEFLDPERGLFYSGRVWYDGNTEEIYATAPVEFILPDDPGAGDFAPRYGCN